MWKIIWLALTGVVVVPLLNKVGGLQDKLEASRAINCRRATWTSKTFGC